MKFIPTTATAANKLRRRANDQRKRTDESPAAALDDVARASGYESWRHVTCCVEQTPASREALGPLPDVLARFLEATARTMPPSEASKQAFAGGLAFALDVKDIEGGLDDDIVFCGDAWAIAGADLLRVFAHEKEYEDDLSLAERMAEKPDLRPRTSGSAAASATCRRCRRCAPAARWWTRLRRQTTGARCAPTRRRAATGRVRGPARRVGPGGALSRSPGRQQRAERPQPVAPALGQATVGSPLPR